MMSENTILRNACSSLQNLCEKIPVSSARRFPIASAVAAICAVGALVIIIRRALSGNRFMPAATKQLLELSKANLGKMSLADAKSNLGQILTHAHCITDPAHKMTVFKMAEIIAEDYITQGKIVEATRVRLDTAGKIRPDTMYDRLVQQLQKKTNTLFHIQPVGTTTLIKHVFWAQNLQFARHREVHVHAKLLGCAREKMNRSLTLIKEDRGELAAELNNRGVCKGIKYRKKPEQTSYVTRWDRENEVFTDVYDKRAVCKVIGWNNAIRYDDVIELEGLGEIRIGCDNECAGEYDHLSVRFAPGIDPETAKEKMLTVFALLGIGEISSGTPKEDEMRLKLMHLFSVLCPEEASLLERDSPEIIAGPIEELEKAIIQRSMGSKSRTDMAKAIKEDLPKMVQKEAFPGGPKVWTIHGIGQKCEQVGLLGLMSGMEAFKNGQPDFQLVVSRLMNVLEFGLLSTQLRLMSGNAAMGASSIRDLEGGGATYTFTRLITKTMNPDPEPYGYSSGIHLLFNSSVLDAGGYGAHDDNNGRKNMDDLQYKQRMSALQLSRELEACADAVEHDAWGRVSQDSYVKNEWAIWAGAVPDKILVKEEAQKQYIIKAMEGKKLIKNGQYNGKPIDKFIVVGKRFEPKYWQD